MNRNHIKFLNFPGTQIPDPFSCVKSTDFSARRLQRLSTSIKKSSCRSAPRRTSRAVRSSAKSGDSNAEPEPEPERPLLLGLNLYDQAALADLLCIARKTLQNIYSVAPHSLPKAIQVPGARGPRWTPQAVHDWLQNRQQHTPKPVPVAPRKKVGRPRIALTGKGGAS